MKNAKSKNPGILFDLDGTLVDTVYQHVSAWSVALRSVGVVIPQWKIHRRVGMSGRSMVQQLLAEQGSLLKVDIGLLEKKHDAGFTKASRDTHILPGSKELLKFLTRKHIRWAIATTGGKEQTARLLKRLDIPAGVPVVTGDDVAKTKPSPDVFVLAADQLGVPIEDCIVTGDSVCGTCSQPPANGPWASACCAAVMAGKNWKGRERFASMLILKRCCSTSKIWASRDD